VGLSTLVKNIQTSGQFFEPLYVQSASNRYLEFGCYCPSGRQPDLKGVPFEWGKCQKEAMQYLKDEVVKSPVLH
jgi:hypothetical protein